MAEPRNSQRNESRETQLNTIRELMLTAARRGTWLTLSEIADLTEIGEASVSAQLRHLRKWRYGRHLVEKRQRLPHPIATGATGHERSHREKPMLSGPVMWEYRVLPSVACNATAVSPEGADVDCCVNLEGKEVVNAEARD